ncbi:MAG: family 20 glycosylhydrolase, partial [Candidatus Thorarchaeota archaeon]
FADVYCPGKDELYTFLKDILDEVVEIFPSKIIHIGGDEVPKTRWKKCEDCKKKAEELGLQDVKKLQIHLTNYFNDYLESKGKRLMGWNQILDSTLSPNAICQFWFGNKKEVLEHMEKGGQIVATNYLSTYLDHPYKIISLKKAYGFEPKFPKMTKDQQKNILGIEAPLWTERISTVERLHWQAFPRLTAYAEVAWAQKDKKKYDYFIRKLESFNKRLALLEIKGAFEKGY